MCHLVNRTAMYYHKITEYGIKCCMHAHHVAPRAPPGRGELYRRKTLFLADFPICYFYPNGTWTHPPTSKLFLDFWNCFNFAKPLSSSTVLCVVLYSSVAVNTTVAVLTLLAGVAALKNKQSLATAAVRVI